MWQQSWSAAAGPSQAVQAAIIIAAGCFLVTIASEVEAKGGAHVIEALLLYAVALVFCPRGICGLFCWRLQWHKMVARATTEQSSRDDPTEHAKGTTLQRAKALVRRGRLLYKQKFGLGSPLFLLKNVANECFEVRATMQFAARCVFHLSVFVFCRFYSRRCRSIQPLASSTQCGCRPLP